MASIESEYLGNLYQNWTARMAANPEMTLEDMRALFDEWEKATKEPEGVTYKSDNIAGVDVLWALPVDADNSKVLVYTHGGGFVVGSSASHRKLAGHMAKALDATCVVLDYRLAPESPFPAQIEDVVVVYEALLGQGIKSKDISMIGDSAGGNLAISSVLKIRELGLPLPGSVIAFSPWLDMEFTGASLESNDSKDFLVKRSILEGMAGMFLGEDGGVNDSLANPLYADFSEFPDLYVNVGSEETLLDDARRIYSIAGDAGVNCVLSEVEGMQHVFPFLAGRAEEADKEIEKISLWYKGLGN